MPFHVYCPASRSEEYNIKDRERANLEATLANAVFGLVKLIDDAPDWAFKPFHLLHDAYERVTHYVHRD